MFLFLHQGLINPTTQPKVFQTLVTSHFVFAFFYFRMQGYPVFRVQVEYSWSQQGLD